MEYSFLAEPTIPKHRVRNQLASHPPEQEPEKQIPTGATLLSLVSAEKILNAKYDGGYSLSSMKRFIRNGQWQFGWHWTRTGRYIKIYEPAIDEWQAAQAKPELLA